MYILAVKNCDLDASLSQTNKESPHQGLCLHASPQHDKICHDADGRIDVWPTSAESRRNNGNGVELYLSAAGWTAQSRIV